MNTTKRTKVIQDIADNERMTVAQIASAIGKPASCLYDIQKGKIKGISEKLADTLLSKFPHYNKTWLMTGEGEMLAITEQPEEPAKAASATSSPGKEPCIVPLLPISAQGGTFNDFTLSVRHCDCEKLISPIYGVDFAISVSGDSMDPEYPSGSQVLIKKVNERAFLEWGKVYVLDTCNGTVIKRLMPTELPDRVRCESINPKYPPFEVSLEHVFGIYRVLMCLSMK